MGSLHLGPAGDQQRGGGLLQSAAAGLVTERAIQRHCVDFLLLGLRSFLAHLYCFFQYLT